MSPPEQEARQQIDALLAAASWHIQDAKAAHIHGARGVAIREFPLASGYGVADYLLYLDGKAAGVIEAKKTGTTLTGVEVQSARYTQGLPAGLPFWHNPLPFCYESTGVEPASPTASIPTPVPAMSLLSTVPNPSPRCLMPPCGPKGSAATPTAPSGPPNRSPRPSSLACSRCRNARPQACGRRRLRRSATSKPRCRTTAPAP